MATHSSTLAWKSPWTEEPGRLQSMGVINSQTGLSNFTYTIFREELLQHLNKGDQGVSALSPPSLLASYSTDFPFMVGR